MHRQGEIELIQSTHGIFPCSIDYDALNSKNIFSHIPVKVVRDSTTKKIMKLNQMQAHNNTAVYLMLMIDRKIVRWFLSSQKQLAGQHLLNSHIILVEK